MSWSCQAIELFKKINMNTGIGVMIGILGGNKETVEAVKSSLSKTIKKVFLSENALTFQFEDGKVVRMFDDGQSCCEDRYMDTDDTLADYDGATLIDLQLVDAPDQEDEWGNTHEIQFLNVVTSKGTFQMSNHNEHNGYYGGFFLVARMDK